MKNGCVAVGDTDMYYVSFGKGNKTLIVLPGLSDGLSTVKGKALLLASPYKKFFEKYTVYMFSRKNTMPEGYTIRAMADDQALAMKKLGIASACVMGVSQGGMIAQYIAIDHPEIVEKLILVVTAPYANETVRDAVNAWIRMAEAGDHVSLMADTAERTYSRAYLDKHRRLFPLVARLTKPKDYERFLKNANAILAFDAREMLSKITAPTLIIAGAEDHIAGNGAACELKQNIGNSELCIYQGLGHGLFEEAGDFYDKVHGFCEK